MPKTYTTVAPLGTIFVSRFMLIHNQSQDVTAFTVWAERLEDIPRAVVETMKSLEEKGFREMTSDEFKEVAEFRMSLESRKLAAEASKDIMNGRQLDPDALDAILRMHKGREGGDA